ncbi:MAG: hypothetical protein M3Y68_04545 [Chloroflexota bacterium]|nr:hypothetical protein [Chloroflexota bacterium]
MLKLFRFQFVLWSFLLISCAGLPVRAQAGEPEFTITTKNNDDQVTVQHQDGVLFVDIQSPTGIGSASFEVTAGSLPHDIVLRLHLTGLEDFRLTSATDSIGISISSGAEPTIQQRLISPSSETPILPGHPLWMTTDIVSEQPEPAIPLDEGYFEIALPKDFLAQAGTSFEIQWIDFYR